MPEINRYWKRLGGPLIDRVDLRVRVEPEGAPQANRNADPEHTDGELGEAEALRRRVAEAVQRQRHRFGDSYICRNAEIPSGELSGYLHASEDDLDVVTEAAQRLSLSTRAVFSVLRVARTIADLEGSDRTARAHLLEAVQHRRLGEGSSWF
jgi:magnesium chelatase family protein